MDVRRFRSRRRPLAGQLPFSMFISANTAVNGG